MTAPIETPPAPFQPGERVRIKQAQWHLQAYIGLECEVLETAWGNAYNSTYLKPLADRPADILVTPRCPFSWTTQYLEKVPS